MLNGDISLFVDNLHYGDEMIFMYRGQKFFIQGLPDPATDRLVLYLARWEPPADDYTWTEAGDTHNYPVESFLQAKLWDGRTFMEAESEMEWVDD